MCDERHRFKLWNQPLAKMHSKAALFYLTDYWNQKPYKQENMKISAVKIVGAGEDKDEKRETKMNKCKKCGMPK